MSDDDPTVNLDAIFGPGGEYEDAQDPADTLRGSVREYDASAPLPLLTVGRFADSNVDIALGPVLGEGGAGVVSLAKQVALDREVAVKTARSTSGEADQLLHEALMMGVVEHPNVVPVHMVGRHADDGSPIIVMKRVEGVSWSDVLRNPERVPTPETVDLDYHLRVLLQLCHALRYAHSEGVVHLDIKPANVMLGAFGEVYLADWGIATRLGPAGRPAPGSIRGTPSFMAPEMVDPEDPQVDVRTDVFLLGATLHRVLTGQPLHDAKTPMETVKRAQTYSGLSLDPDTVDPELAQLTMKAVARTPEDRFQSVEAFQAALQDYLDHRESHTLARIAARDVDALVSGLNSNGVADPERLAEARFALRRALQIWPDNPEAQALRGQLAEAVFAYALDDEDVREAERALAELPEDVRADYGARLDALRTKLDAEREALAELRSRQDQLTGYRTRLTIGIAISVVWCAIAGFKAWKRWGVPLDEVDPNYLPSLVPTFAVPAVLLVVFRRLFFTSEFNRRVLIFFVSGLVAVASIRTMGWALELPAYVATAMEFVMYATIALLFGTLTDLRVTAAGLLIAAAAVLAVVFPMYQYAFMFVAFAIFAPYVGVIWARSGASD